MSIALSLASFKIPLSILYFSSSSTSILYSLEFIIWFRAGSKAWDALYPASPTVRLYFEYSKYSLTVGDAGYNASQALLPALNQMINSNEYKIEVDDEEKYNMLNGILKDARDSAMDIMLKTDDRLKILTSANE